MPKLENVLKTPSEGAVGDAPTAMADAPAPQPPPPATVGYEADLSKMADALRRSGTCYSRSHAQP